jgi:hypothetical protein
VGTAPFTVVGVAAGQPTQYAGAQVSVVGPTKRSFAISGTATGLLMPGASTPIDLSIDNTSNNQNLLVDNLSVSVSGVTRASGVTAACTPSDFAVVQYSGGYPLTVPAGSTRTLSALSVPVANRPQLQMLDTSSNQDGCKNASLTLSYNGTGHGG